jgi:hypothetical protein
MQSSADALQAAKAMPGWHPAARLRSSSRSRSWRVSDAARSKPESDSNLFLPRSALVRGKRRLHHGGSAGGIRQLVRVGLFLFLGEHHESHSLVPLSKSSLLPQLG